MRKTINKYLRCPVMRAIVRSENEVLEKLNSLISPTLSYSEAKKAYKKEIGTTKDFEKHFEIQDKIEEMLGFFHANQIQPKPGMQFQIDELKMAFSIQKILLRKFDDENFAIYVFCDSLRYPLPF